MTKSVSESLTGSDCGHAHELPEHKALVKRNYHRVEMLVVADLDGTTKLFRVPTSHELEAALRAETELSSRTINGFPACPDEGVPIGTNTIMAGLYGALTYGDLAVQRQNLLHASIAQAIADIAESLMSAGVSHDYASALAGYCAAALARKQKYSTRGAVLQIHKGSATSATVQVNHIFVNESSIAFNYDSFETGIGYGPGTWDSMSGVPSGLKVLTATAGKSAEVQRGSALSLPFGDATLDAVVTDPPYEMMIDYSDASDLYYVWLKRALAQVNPDFAMTSHPKGVQEKAEELIVKKHYSNLNDHRTPEFYATNIAKAFAECHRVVHNDGVVTIVFGHGDPDAWRALLGAISQAGLVLTGAWPANTEGGGAPGSANINTTLTLACRPAPAQRPTGRAADVDRELRALVAERVHEVWKPSRLSYVDQKMAAAGPALEVVGRYSEVLDARGRPVDLARYLPMARQAVTDAHDLKFGSLPLEIFDRRTRFALEWVRSHGRRVQAKSEARWQRLAADMEDHETDGLLHDVTEGVRLAFSTETSPVIVPGSATVDIAMAAAAAWREGTLDDAASVIRTAGLDPNDAHFWAVVSAMEQNLPETDKDGSVWTTMTRQKAGLAGAVESGEHADTTRDRVAQANPRMFDLPTGDPSTLFAHPGGLSTEETK